MMSGKEGLGYSQHANSSRRCSVVLSSGFCTGHPFQTCQTIVMSQMTYYTLCIYTMFHVLSSVCILEV